MLELAIRRFESGVIPENKFLTEGMPQIERGGEKSSRVCDGRLSRSQSSQRHTLPVRGTLSSCTDARPPPTIANKPQATIIVTITAISQLCVGGISIVTVVTSVQQSRSSRQGLLDAGKVEERCNLFSARLSASSGCRRLVVGHEK